MFVRGKPIFRDFRLTKEPLYISVIFLNKDRIGIELYHPCKAIWAVCGNSRDGHERKLFYLASYLMIAGVYREETNTVHKAV